MCYLPARTPLYRTSRSAIARLDNTEARLQRNDAMHFTLRAETCAALYGPATAFTTRRPLEMWVLSPRNLRRLGRKLDEYFEDSPCGTVAGLTKAQVHALFFRMFEGGNTFVAGRETYYMVKCEEGQVTGMDDLGRDVTFPRSRITLTDGKRKNSLADIVQNEAMDTGVSTKDLFEQQICGPPSPHSCLSIAFANIIKWMGFDGCRVNDREWRRPHGHEDAFMHEEVMVCNPFTSLCEVCTQVSVSESQLQLARSVIETGRTRRRRSHQRDS